MKIIIPMSGIGNRFVNAGYEFPKPLIKVEGKSIIEHIVSIFGDDHSYIFICNNDHLRNTNMEEILRKIKPNSKIISIEKHNSGPVYALTHAFDYIGDNEDILISYCDYFMEWDFEDFQNKIIEGNFDGAVPCYTGFHPHILRKNVYAGVLTDNQNVMTDICEKHSFTENLEKGFNSVGVYYFRYGKDLKKYHTELLSSGICLRGEVYTSMIYHLYLRDNKKVYVPEVKRFMQWGTPNDLEEYESWSRYFHNELGKEKLITDIPKHREDLIKIPYTTETDEFEKCYTYWKLYFSK